MLGDTDVGAVVAVKDLERARRFYRDTLGLAESGGMGETLIMFRSGAATLAVYLSDFAGTNKATALSWRVDDVAAEVAALKAKGVSFEHYDMPGLTRDGDLHQGGGMTSAWFKDPDGNILNLVGET